MMQKHIESSEVHLCHKRAIRFALLCANMAENIAIAWKLRSASSQPRFWVDSIMNTGSNELRLKSDLIFAEDRGFFGDLNSCKLVSAIWLMKESESCLWAC